MTSSDLHNFADDNTIAAMGETIQDSVNILQDESEKANQMVGSDINDMIANPEKLEAIILSKQN